MGGLDIGTLLGHIKLDDQLSSALTLAQQKMNAFAGQFNQLGQTLSAAGRTMSLAITLPLVAAGAASLSLSGEFEKVTTRLVSLGGVAAHELEGVRKAILDMAPAVGVGPVALAEAMMKISSTVSDAKLGLEILEIAAKGSAAGMGEAVDVAGALTSVINSYGKENITAARAGDILTQAIKDGGAEAKDLAPTLANIVPLAAQMGISFEEVAANIATVTKLGTPAAEAVTQITSVLTALNKESDEGAEALAKVGLSYQRLRDISNETTGGAGLAAMIELLTEKLGGNETALVKVFGRMEAVKDIMSVTGAQAQIYADTLDNIKTKSGQLEAAFKQMEGTQTHTWAQFVAQIQTVAIAVGNELAPALNSILVAMRPLLTGVASLISWFAQLPGPVKTVTLGVLAFAAVIGPLVIVLGSIASAIGTLIPLYGLLTTALFMTGNTVVVLTARIWLMEAAAKAGAAASAIFAGSFSLLGSGVIVGLLIAASAAIWGVVNAVKGLNQAWAEGKSTWEFLSQRDDDNFVRRWLGLSSALKEVKQPLIDTADAVKNLKAQLTGALETKNAADLQKVFEDLSKSGELTAGTINRIAKAGKAARDAGAPLSHDIKVLVDAYEAEAKAVEKAATAANKKAQADQFAADAAKELAKRQFEVHKEIEATIKGYGNLSDQQKKDIDNLLKYEIAIDKIAVELKITEGAVKAYTNQLKKNEEQIEASMAKAKEFVDAQIDATAAVDKSRRDAMKTQLAIGEEYAEKNRQLWMTESEIRLRVIELEKDALLAALKEEETGRTGASIRARVEIERYIDYLNDLANNTSSTITRRMTEMGIFSRVELQKLADQAKRDFEDMRRSGVYTAEQVQAAFERYTDAQHRAHPEILASWNAILAVADAVNFKWDTYAQEIGAVAQAFDVLGQSMEGTAGRVASSLGEITASFANWIELSKKTRTTTEIISAVAQGAIGVWQSTSGTEKGKTAAGAMAGAKAGMAFGPVGAGIGAGIGALVGYTRGLNDGRQAVEEFVKASGGFDTVHKKLATLGKAGEDLWVKLTQEVGRGNVDQAIAAIKEIEEAIAALTADVEKYGMTWRDMSDPAHILSMTRQEADKLAASFSRLTGAGFSEESVIRQMSGDLNQFIANSLAAGTGIPPALQKIVEKLIRTKQLTEENARAMLGLAADTMPSLASITEAANRYGLKLDDLGQKVQQLRLTDEANQIVTDFNLLTLAGVPFETLMKNIIKETTNAEGQIETSTTGMQADIQRLVTNALTLGLSLPDTMKPLIAAMIEAGLLVDPTGVKLDSLGQLTFVQPLTEKIDDLISALYDLVDVFKLMGDEAVEQFARARGEAEKLGTAIPRNGIGSALPIPTPAPTPALGTTPTPTPAPTPALGVGDGPGDARPRGLSGGHTFNVIAWDGKSVQDWLNAGGDRILAEATVPFIPEFVDRYVDGELV